MSAKPAMMPCHEVAAQLWAYIDGELTPDKVHAIRAHLGECNRCWPHYDFERAFLEFLRRHARQTVPPELRLRVFQQLLAEV